jgi:dTDP-4-amino-4,6-dideoxygalactose transaminase
MSSVDFTIVEEFEKQIAAFFGAPYAIAVDCCTHAIELCLRDQEVQFRKHLSLGRGGMILTNDREAAIRLKKMSYDGRLPNIPWREQDISSVGYHYYMTPETAQLGLEKLPSAIETQPEKWIISDWPDLTQMEIFK